MVAKRLLSYIEYKNLSLYAFENSINASRGSISKAVKEGKNIGSGVLENILIKYQDLSPAWLLIGKGEMITDASLNTGGNTGGNTGVEQEILSELGSKWWKFGKKHEELPEPESIRMVRESVVKYMPLDEFEEMLTDEQMEVFLEFKKNYRMCYLENQKLKDKLLDLNDFIDIVVAQVKRI